MGNGQIEGLHTLTDRDARVLIYHGQIVSFKIGDEEYFHTAGKPEAMKTPEEKNNTLGWGLSEIVMFPVVGPVKNYRVRIGNTDYPQDQHGQMRNESSSKVFTEKNQAEFFIANKKDIPIQNPKHLFDSERPSHLRFPFSYVLYKNIVLNHNSLYIKFGIANLNSTNMPYQFGWHPSGKTHGDFKDGIFVFEDTFAVTLEEVLDYSQNKWQSAYHAPKMNSVKYMNIKTGKGIEYMSENFANMMLWIPDRDAGHFCAEPVTHLPLGSGDQNLSEKGRSILQAPMSQSSIKEYSVIIRPF